MNDSQRIPIVRLQVDSIRESMQCAFAAHGEEYQTMLQTAIDAVCTPETLQEAILIEAKREMKNAIHNQVQRFYTLGLGRELVEEAVNLLLAKPEKDQEVPDDTTNTV